MSKCYVKIIVPASVKGDKGTEMSVYPYKNYCFKKEGMEYDDECSSYIKGYYFEHEKELFFISEKNAMKIDKEEPEDDQLSLSEKFRKEHLVDNQARDYKKEVLKNIGLDVIKGQRADYNGRFLQKILDKKN